MGRVPLLKSTKPKKNRVPTSSKLSGLVEVFPSKLRFCQGKIGTCTQFDPDGYVRVRLSSGELKAWVACAVSTNALCPKATAGQGCCKREIKRERIQIDWAFLAFASPFRALLNVGD